MEINAKFYAVTAFLPGVGVADFVHCVPRVHGSCGKGIADSGVALRGEPRRSPSVWPAEAYSLNAELTDDVIHGIVLRSAIHRQSRHCDRYGIHFVRGENMIPGNRRLLRPVIEVGTESRKIFGGGSHSAAGGEAVLLTNRVTP